MSVLRHLTVLIAIVLSPAGSLAAADLTAFAAASLKTALDRIEDRWEKETGLDLTVSLAGSSVLARQIELGAHADVFISANPDWMDALESKGFIRPDTRRDLLGNALVLVASGSELPSIALTDLPEALGDGRLAMALVDAVPAGVYGKAALTNLGLWNTVGPRVVQTDNVRTALALVATGEAHFGIVYATDARADKDVSVVATFPGESHPPIVYPAAVTAEAVSPYASSFLDWLADPAARAVFEAEGFRVFD